MMTSVRKTLKTLVWSVQNWSISSEICLENNHKIGRFLSIAFWWSLPWKLPWNSCEIGQFFREFVPKNPTKFDFFFCDPSEALFKSVLIPFSQKWGLLLLRYLPSVVSAILTLSTNSPEKQFTKFQISFGKTLRNKWYYSSKVVLKGFHLNGPCNTIIFQKNGEASKD